MANHKLSNYWFGSGTPSYIINVMKKFQTSIKDIEKKDVGITDFDVSPEQMTPLYRYSTKAAISR